MTITGSVRTMAAGAILAVCASSAGAESKNPVVLLPPVIVVDGTSSSGNVLVQIRNDATTPLQISMTTGDVVSKASGRKINAQIVFAKPTEANGSNPYMTTAAPGEVLYIKATVSGMSEAGEAEADLINNGTKISS